MRFSYYKLQTAIQHAVWCDFAILQAVVVRFSEHPYFKRYVGPWLLSKFREDSTLSHSEGEKMHSTQINNEI